MFYIQARRSKIAILVSDLDHFFVDYFNGEISEEDKVISFIVAKIEEDDLKAVMKKAREIAHSEGEEIAYFGR